ncbi:uncharacterized protein [Atheta coriaria]|uniref:uncharacterized protein isoform X2 n=1 Tax=Dalotia coriaria TaxID=877792 RepID=UPI0031F43A2F
MNATTGNLTLPLGATPPTLANVTGGFLLLGGARVGGEARATTTSSLVTTTTKLPYVPVAPNATLPPEQYRFIPGSTPTFTNGTVITPRLREPPFNGTGYYIEDGEAEAGLNEIQTLFLACFATLIPLVIILATGFTIRILWKRYKRRRNCMNYDGVVHRDSSVESNDRPLHSHLLNGDKYGETHINTEELCDGEIVNGIKSSGTHRNHATTNDIEEDSRETTMKYSPSARDGVFVVEVQQGGRRGGPNCNKTPGIAGGEQCALIHQPPERFDDELLEGDEKFYPETTSPKHRTPERLPCKTGLTQSNQSLSNQSYAYGNQQGYDNGSYGYPTYAGYVNDEPLQKLEDRDKPKITAAIYKNHDSFDQLDADVDDDQKEQIRLGNEHRTSQED